MVVCFIIWLCPIKVTFTFRLEATSERTHVSIFLRQLNLIFSLTDKFLVTLVPKIQSLAMPLHKHETRMMPGNFFVFKAALAFVSALELDAGIVCRAMLHCRSCLDDLNRERLRTLFLLALLVYLVFGAHSRHIGHCPI